MQRRIPWRRGTIKARILSIALIPCAAVLLIGSTVAVYFIDSGLASQRYVEETRNAIKPAAALVAAAQEERRLSMGKVAGADVDESALAAQREQVDAILAKLIVKVEAMARGEIPAMWGWVRTARAVQDRLPGVRTRIDRGTIEPEQAPEQAMATFNDLVDLMKIGRLSVTRRAPEPEQTFEHLTAFEFLIASEEMAQAHALGVLGAYDHLDEDGWHEFAHLSGAFRERLRAVEQRMTPGERSRYGELIASGAWRTLAEGDEALWHTAEQHHGGHSDLEIAFDRDEWEAAAKVLATELPKFYLSHAWHALDLGDQQGSRDLTTSILVALATVVFAGAAIAVSLQLSRRMIGRLRGLREDTLNLAQRDLPQLVQRVGRGERFDPDTDVAWLQHGDDEIGEVAQAFNTAQRTAIDTALAEAETREGVKSVFLNIAHRNQAMVHRQLKVLDEIERAEDDPEKLALLFRLDHLSTQGRRNAENLIVLSGEQPSRQWRKPVPLQEIIRGAVGESEHYTRVATHNLPDTPIDGKVVADIGHLIAELVDNATSFSPPQSRVEVRGNVVGRGIVVEIEDQGLGMSADQLAELNGMLADPPDFSVMALSRESRIGLFVVARLAGKHGIKITLRESVYGGTLAIVLVPATLVATAERAPEPAGQPTAERPTAPAGQSAPRPRPKPEPDYTGAADSLDAPTRMVVRLGGSDATAQLVPAAVAVKEPAPANGNGTSPNGAAQNGQRPTLPKRTRQANLAPQLASDPAPQPEPAAPVWPAESPEGPNTAERSRAALTAFQRGTERAREADIDGDAESWWAE